MANAPILPRGSGTNRRGFDRLIKDIVAYYPQAYKNAYLNEFQILIKDIIDTTPIDTGAAAGVTQNSVGSQKSQLGPNHKAYGAPISNNPGGTGWQLVQNQSKDINISIINPQWNSYLKFLELGIVQPIAPATSHFVFRAWQAHLHRREKIREIIKRGRS